MLRSSSLILFFIAFTLVQYSCKKKIETKSANAKKAIISPQIQSPTRNPLYQSFDAGKTWQATKHNLPIGTQVSFLAAMNNQIVMATDNEGLFLSDNQKMDWTSIGDSLPNKKINALHVADNVEIYVGVFRQGLYFSSDKGKNWVSLSYDLPDLRVNAILKNEVGLLAGTDYGIFQLKKGASNWQSHSEDVQITSFSIKGEKVVAGTNKGVLMFNNLGQKWEWIHQKGAIHTIAILNNTIVAMYVSSDLFISKNWGTTWKTGHYHPKIASYGYAAATQNGNTFILSNNYGVHESNDGGLNWTLIYKDEDKIFFDFLVDGAVLYAGTRGWRERRAR